MGRGSGAWESLSAPPAFFILALWYQNYTR